MGSLSLTGHRVKHTASLSLALDQKSQRDISLVSFMSHHIAIKIDAKERERVKHPAVNIEKKITEVNSFRTSSNNCKKTFLCVLWCPIGKE